MEMVPLLLVAAAAGWVDAVVGGGGLLLLPALLLVFPGAAPATALGTNKLAAVSGTAFAGWTYFRRVPVNANLLLPTFLLAFAFAALGAYVASSLPAEVFKPIILLLLVAVGVFVAVRPRFGASPDAPATPTRQKALIAVVLCGVVIGFYDGILGPGTGTFLIIALTMFLSQGFLQSAAMAKVINTGTNLGALTVFASQGHVMWLVGIGLAAANIIGARTGAHMAINRGSGFIRLVLLAVVIAMVLRLTFDLVAP
ncbi:sulfite exporter TauE/SafE family protein [Hoyosella subflava]|uniref:Probable membrane transporter protein n=1 Tax=Hoyosella subflava (strain DSM 45089 / JCM 17490 / NBRC 109087 / DQS3-9A1) TaxID=443218 RepID=F6EPW3_HOYSD|nr:TSUP family transporter [Hoyosella subflava]AEF40592.1 hypothetical protein AS9A_2143 [Hoyosella subflava DQS3-9A1]